MRLTPRREQFSGCLIGQCLGDACGCPVEGFPPDHCRYYVREFLKTSLAGSFGRGLFPFGQYTDDSQLARELLQSYVACEEFDPADYARRIAAIFVEKRIVAPGRASSESAQRLAAGVPWAEAGAPPPTASNGSAMRAGPIGLMFWDDPGAMIRAACDQGRITHQDPRCLAGAVAIAGAVALALRRDPIETPAFVSQLAEWVQSIEPSVAVALRKLSEWISLTPEDAGPAISAAVLAPSDGGTWEGISPFVTTSVLWSLYSFLRTPEEYWETICTAIGVGGDVDTTAAMAGAVSGAHLGLEAIPMELARRVTDQGTWGFDELVELAHQAYGLKVEGEG